MHTDREMDGGSDFNRCSTGLLMYLIKNDMNKHVCKKVK
jgi:hypothetical protein